MNKASKPFSIFSNNPRVGQPYAVRGYAEGGQVPERDTPEDAKLVDRSSGANRTPLGEKPSTSVGVSSQAAGGDRVSTVATKRYSKAQLTAVDNAYDNRRTNTTIGAAVSKEDKANAQLMQKFGKQF
jgi:hypothetical protein